MAAVGPPGFFDLSPLEKRAVLTMLGTTEAKLADVDPDELRQVATYARRLRSSGFIQEPRSWI